MFTTAQVLQALREKMEAFQRTYHVRSMALFGSYSRGEQTENSDIDLLVEFSEPIGGLRFVQLADDLEQLFGRSVDLVPGDGVKSHYLDHIRGELIHV